MKGLAFVLILSLPFAATSIVAAQPQTFTVSPDASSVAFSLTGTGHEVHGTFRVQSGTVEFDPGKPAMSGSIVVTAASGESGDKGRDKKMHTDVLDVEHFADVIFKPESYQGSIASSGDSSIQVSGTFTLHGTPHEITVPMQVHVEGANISAQGNFVVPYVNWGLKDPSIFILKVAKEVKIDLDLKGTLTGRE